MSKIIVTLFALLAASSQYVYAKGDAAAGKTQSTACISCHGAAGISSNEIWPSLADQGQAYLVKQLRAFRDGSRKDPLMQAQAVTLTDDGIDNLAAYYSTLTAASAAQEVATVPAVVAAVAHAPIIASPEIFSPHPYPTREYWASKLPQGEGRAVIVQKCQLCHDLQRVAAAVRPKEQWQGVVDAMVRRGSPVTAEEEPVVVDYFAKYFGPDSAPVPELGRRACKPGDWPKGSSDFRRNWKGSYNLWVSNQQEGSVDIIDPITKKILHRITCITAPDLTEFSGDGNTAFTPDRVEHNITVIDTHTGAIKTKIPLIDRPNSAALTRDFKKLYVGIWPLKADEDKHGYIQVIDTASLKVVKTIETNGGIHLPIMSPDGKLLLALSSAGKFMEVYDTATDKLLYTCCTAAEIGTMNVEPGPDGASNRFFFSYVGFPGVVAVDAKTGQELERVHDQTMAATGYHGSEISADGKNYWVIQFSNVYRYEVPSLKPIGNVHLAQVDQMGNPLFPPVEGNALTLSPDGQKVYALRGGRSLLSVIDVKSMTEEALIPTGQYGLHVSVWPRGTP